MFNPKITNSQHNTPKYVFYYTDNIPQEMQKLHTLKLIFGFKCLQRGKMVNFMSLFLQIESHCFLDSIFNKNYVHNKTQIMYYFYILEINARQLYHKNAKDTQNIILLCTNKKINISLQGANSLNHSSRLKYRSLRLMKTKFRLSK